MNNYKEMSSASFFEWVVPFIVGDFDIIQCHFGPAGVRSICLKKAGLISKLVTAFHGYDVTVHVRENGEGVYSELFETGDLFTYNSEATKEKILALGCPEGRMKKLPMGIHLDKIPFSERSIKEGDRIKVLSVGRLVEMKGREYAIKAVAQVLRDHPNIRYNIVGDGPLREELEKLIKELGVEDQIKLLGWVSDAELEELYKSSHIFLHPSVAAGNGNMEGQGVVLVEAQAYGMPVLATSHNAFIETVAEGRSGYLVPERDVESLADRLKYLIEHSELWPEMGRAGREHAEKYDIIKLNRALVGIYEQLLAK